VTRQLRLLRILTVQEVRMMMNHRWWLFLLQVANVLPPAIALLVWHGAIDQGADPPVSTTYLTSYLVLVSVVAMITSSWTSGFLAASIRLGGLNSWLVRPCSTHFSYLANNCAEKLLKLGLIAPPVVVLGLIFRQDLRLPGEPQRWLLFLPALVMAAAMTFALDILIGSLAFWMEDIAAIDRLRYLLARLLSGGLVPLALFPAVFQPFLAAQPFRFLVSFPLEVLLGTTRAIDYAYQAGWFAVLVGGAVLVWRRGLRDYQGAGA
jgi:ABC-2 type transport system permease protein